MALAERPNIEQVRVVLFGEDIHDVYAGTLERLRTGK